jgi:tRNA-Thr(GGU) m(6)t(6)A37 methyltransferase TsaA
VTAAAPLPARAIGVVRCAVAEGVDEDWGDVVSELHLEPELARGLDGIEDFSHVLVVYWMHASSFDAATDLVRRPRGRADMPERGIFAQRAKHRPNPIGITAVAVVGREGPVLRVRGLDAIDGTPLVDVKPYLPAFDRIDAPTVPEWADRLMRGYF